ncbi:MAG TPA: TetR/AcrR family transcriptional regulator C-terminal domain-containing protein, partial [Bacillota bacterium]|nr:TetR/AcrR family transcriptional regulator C-terminal domain-containing protein [Bacillota bacterium]
RQSNASLRKKINLVLKPYLTLIDSIIQEGMKENVFRENLHLPIVRQMIFGTMDEAVTNWVMQDGKYDLVEQAEEVHDLLTSGISGQ